MAKYSGDRTVVWYDESVDEFVYKEVLRKLQIDRKIDHQIIFFII